MQRLVLAVLGGMVAVGCGGDVSQAPAQQNGKVAPEDVPFDVHEAIRSIRLRYMVEEDAIIGGVENLDVRAKAGIVTMTPLHWRWSDDAVVDTQVSPEAKIIEGSALQLETVAIERSEPTYLGEGESIVQPDGTLRIDRLVAQEIFLNDDRSVEQTWRFDQAPPGYGDLTIRVRTAGQSYVGQDEDGHHFMDERTQAGVNYGNATWIDGAGRTTSVPVTFDDGDLVIVIDAETVDSAAYPAVLDPVITAEFALTNPGSGNPSTFVQQQVAVAYDSVNDNYLAVWSDQRNGASFDIYGGRFDQTNTLLDGVSFPIATSDNNQVAPSVDFNGTEYLVVWADFVNGTDFNIVGRRVSQAGVLQDAEITISNAAGDQTDPAVAADGNNNWVVAWTDARSGTNNIWFQRLSNIGALQGANTAVNAGAAAQGNAEVAASSTTALVVYTDFSNATDDIRGARIDPTNGTVLGDGAIAASGSDDEFADVAFDGSNYLVVYHRQGQGNARDINGQRVNQDGVIGDTLDGFVINGSASNQRRARVSFGNGEFMVVWQDDRNLAATSLNVYGTTVQIDGTVDSPNGTGINLVSDVQDLPDVAGGSTGFFSAWEDERGRRTDIYGVAINGNGQATNSTGFVISTSANRQFAPAVAFDDPFYFIVFQDSRKSGGTNYDLKAVRIRRQGIIVDPNGLNISTAPGNQAQPDIAYDATNDEFLVVWSDNRNPERDVRGTLVRGYAAQGEIVIASAAGEEKTRARVAYNLNANRYLVVWQDDRGGDFDIYGGRISPITGTVVDPGGFLIETAAGDQQNPDVSSDDLTWLTVWSDERAGDTTDDIFGELVNFAGAPQGSFLISGAANEQLAPRTEYDNTNYVVVWQDLRNATSDVFASRVTPAGVTLDPAGLPIANSVTLDEGRPSIDIITDTINGDTWVIPWVQDNAPGVEENDLVGRQFDNTGTPVAATFTISAVAGGSEDQPEISNGRADNCLVTYQRFDNSALINQERVFARIVRFP